MHLLRLVKIKIHSWLGSCHSRYNYDIEDCCLNWSCYSMRLFKDGLGNLIHVRQDLGPNQEQVLLQLLLRLLLLQVLKVNTWNPANLARIEMT